jgi:hypothetical protein
MIRFPTKPEPYVKLYRLQLKGTYTGRRASVVTYDEERILTANVTSRKYYPNDDLLQRLAPENIKSTISRFEYMLTL